MMVIDFQLFLTMVSKVNRSEPYSMPNNAVFLLNALSAPA